jgi:hypothetical protein
VFLVVKKTVIQLLTHYLDGRNSFADYIKALLMPLNGDLFRGGNYGSAMVWQFGIHYYMQGET